MTNWLRKRATRATLVALAVVGAVVAAALAGPRAPVLHRAGAAGAAFHGAGGSVTKPPAGIAQKGKLPKAIALSRPHVLHLTKARSAVFDVRGLKSRVVRRERPEVGSPEDLRAESETTAAALPATARPAAPSAAGAAPAPTASFDGLDFANWGAGHPPDTNGDVGPGYYIQTINSSLGIYDKTTGNRVAAFTFNAFMSQGRFGNLCDTDNFGDPVVLYDSYENRWFLTDFAFKLDGAGNVVAPAYQCFAVSRTADPVAGGVPAWSREFPGSSVKSLVGAWKSASWADGAPAYIRALSRAQTWGARYELPEPKLNMFALM